MEPAPEEPSTRGESSVGIYHVRENVRKEIIDITDLVSNFGGPAQDHERLIGIADSARLRDLLDQLRADASEISATRTGDRIHISVSDHVRPASLHSTLEGSGARIVFGSAYAVVSIPSLDPESLAGRGRWTPKTS
ncbi:MAG: hypothetical protein ACYDCC_11815 [Actinomycetota bacterium]